MRKIPTLFVRDPETQLRYVTREYAPGTEWVVRGEGVATRKYDGTCVRILPDQSVWARREVKSGKPFPPYFDKVEHDDITGKTVGWEPYGLSGFAKYILEAYDNQPPGTYELCGPKINGNPEGLDENVLIPHGQFLVDPPTDYDGLVLWSRSFPYEGIVWHHPDGRMVKIKRKDFPRE